MLKINAKFIYDISKNENKFYKDFKDLLKLYVERCFKSWFCTICITRR